MKVRWTCTECEKETLVDVSPVIPARIYGPPEDCYPEEGGEIEPRDCEHCGAPISEYEAFELANDQASDDAASRADARNDG